RCTPLLRGRTIWMINSTASGGGVAELLPAQIGLLCELGVDVRWAVIEGPVEFFAFTKRLHNMIHGSPGVAPSADERALYESVGRDNADQLRPLVKPDDILVVHDPQPLLVGALLKDEIGAPALWRCHIGLEQESAHANTAWEFLRPYISAYDHHVFSLAEYAPDFVRDNATVINPSIDPLSHKNRDLSLHKLVGILADSQLTVPHWPLLDEPFGAPARRLQSIGSFAAATEPDDIGLLARPIVTQVSRWDRLKGFVPLLDAFVQFKRDGDGRSDERQRRRTQLARLVLAGPDPDAIQDDPEGSEVVDELRRRFMALPDAIRADVAILALPMASRKQNALMVNALQRSSDIVVQNSLREGFGLTVAEAMWKRIPILGSARASGVKLQVRDGIEGRLTNDPEDADEVSQVLYEMLADPPQLEEWGRNAQRRVHDDFLIFTELRRWLQVLTDLVVGP
ncbi:MAG TPA: glycosyltransferase, partial [Longimicrobiales bacterium]